MKPLIYVDNIIDPKTFLLPNIKKKRTIKFGNSFRIQTYQSHIYYGDSSKSQRGIPINFFNYNSQKNFDDYRHRTIYSDISEKNRKIKCGNKKCHNRKSIESFTLTTIPKIIKKNEVKFMSFPYTKPTIENTFSKLISKRNIKTKSILDLKIKIKEPNCISSYYDYYLEKAKSSAHLNEILKIM